MKLVSDALHATTIITITFVRCLFSDALMHLPAETRLVYKHQIACGYRSMHMSTFPYILYNHTEK